LDAPVQRLCGPDIPAMPYAGPMEKFFMLSPEKCHEAMLKLAKF
jgi:2-oxoisovalerate dehydrogenase E1 component beta subunit